MYNTRHNWELRFINKTDSGRPIIDPYCVTNLNYHLRLQVHRNLTTLNVLKSLSLAFQISVWTCIIALFFMFPILIMCYFRFSSSANPNYPRHTLLDLIIITMSMLLSQINTRFINRARNCGISVEITVSLVLGGTFLISLIYSSLFISYFAVRPKVRLPQNIDAALSLPVNQLTLLSMFETVTSDGDYPQTFLKHQTILQALQYGYTPIQERLRLYKFLTRIAEPVESLKSNLEIGVDHMFNLTFGLPIALVYTPATNLTGSTNSRLPNNVATASSNGLFGLIISDRSVQFFDIIQQVSKLYTNLGQIYYNKELKIDESSIVARYQSKFMGDKFHKQLAWFGNMGLYQKWMKLRELAWNRTIIQKYWEDLKVKYNLSPDSAIDDKNNGLTIEKLWEIFKFQSCFYIFSTICLAIETVVGKINLYCTR